MLNPSRAISVISVWMIIVTCMMFAFGFTNSDFFKFGPNSSVKFFQTTIDTWGKWLCVVIYTIINQIIQTYGLETITPWMLNEVQNKRVHTLQESPARTQIVIQIWYIYMWSGRIFGIQIMLTQIDFLFVVLLSDLIATFATTQLYIRQKHRKKLYLLGDQLRDGSGSGSGSSEDLPV